MTERKIKLRERELHAAKYPCGSCVKVITLKDGQVMVSVTAPPLCANTIDEPEHDCIVCKG